MALTEAEVVEEVRGHLGGPSEEKLANTEILRAMREGLRQLSRYRPIQSEYEIALVPGVSDYAIPPGVQDILEEADQTALTFTVDPVFGGSIEGSVPDALDVMAQRTASLRAKELLHPRDVMLLDNDTVRISPTPRDSRPAVLLLGMTRSVGQVTPDVHEQFLDYVRGTCMIHMGLARNTRVLKVPTATGSLMFDNGEHLYKHGAALRSAAISGWGASATQVGAG